MTRYILNHPQKNREKNHTTIRQSPLVELGLGLEPRSQNKTKLTNKQKLITPVACQLSKHVGTERCLDN